MTPVDGSRTVGWTLAVGLAAALAAPLAAAHGGAFVLNDEDPDRPRCYVFTIAVEQGEGLDSVQYFRETNGKLTGGTENGTGQGNMVMWQAEGIANGFDVDPPLAETMREPSGLQHPTAWWNKMSQDPVAASENPDAQLNRAEFAETCLER